MAAKVAASGWLRTRSPAQQPQARQPRDEYRAHAHPASYSGRSRTSATRLVSSVVRRRRSGTKSSCAPHAHARRMLARPACSLAPHARPLCVLVRSARSSALRTRLPRVLAGPACSSARHARLPDVLVRSVCSPPGVLVRSVCLSAPHARPPHTLVGPCMLARPACSCAPRPRRREGQSPAPEDTPALRRPAHPGPPLNAICMPSVALGRGSVRSQPRPTQKASCRREGLVTPKKVEAYPTGARTARTLTRAPIDSQPQS